MTFRNVLLLLALVWAADLHAQCNTLVPPGTLSGDVWNAAGSPYCLEGDVLVNSLSVEPGVRVEALSDDIQITVAGVLTAVGTELNPIVFTRNEAASTWGGIGFDNALPGSELAHVVIENGQIGVFVLDGTAPSIRDCVIRNHTRNFNTLGGGGVYTNIPLTLTRCQILNNSLVGSGGNVAGGGIFGETDLVLIDTIVSGNTVSVDVPQFSEWQAYGAGIHVQTGTLTVLDSEITDNHAFGTALQSTTNVSVYGGGLSVFGALVLTRSVIDSNTTRAEAATFATGFSGGAGLLAGNVDIVNSCIARNASSESGDVDLQGGGLYVYNGG
jgi:hypothetical protein